MRRHAGMEMYIYYFRLVLVVSFDYILAQGRQISWSVVGDWGRSLELPYYNAFELSHECMDGPCCER